MGERYSYDRSEALAAGFDRSGGDPSEGTSTRLLQTYSAGAYPTEPRRVYACRPASASASPAEGSAATFSADAGRTVLAANMGNSVPPEGTYVLATNESGVWTFRYDE